MRFYIFALKPAGNLSAVAESDQLVPKGFKASKDPSGLKVIRAMPARKEFKEYKA